MRQERKLIQGGVGVQASAAATPLHGDKVGAFGFGCGGMQAVVPVAIAGLIGHIVILADGGSGFDWTKG
jgi:hypothetical protein